jgi:glycerophosphoryl diester phosphodiesterase
VENTLGGVLEAVRLGADAVEVDVRPTRDGVAVLHHDPTLARLWKHGAAVASLTSVQLRGLAPQVPTLHETLAAVRGYGVALVLDVGSVPAARAALQALEAVRGPVEAAAWFCGDPGALGWLRAQNERLPLMLTWDRCTPPPERLVRAVAPTFFNPWHRLLGPDVIGSWHDRGVLVSTWTVDSAARRRRLLGWGVDALISNDVEATVRDVTDRPGVREEVA